MLLNISMVLNQSLLTQTMLHVHEVSFAKKKKLQLDREKRQGMLRRCCSRFIYVYFFLFLVFLQGILIYLQSSGIPKKPLRTHSSRCVNKTHVLSKRKQPQSKEQDCIRKHESGRKRFAYVFYITRSKPEYECYLYVNLHILQTVYPRVCDVDYVVLYEEGYKFQEVLKQQFKRIKMFPVKRRRLKVKAYDKYFAECFLKLEVFRLYEFYDRVLFTDVDGVFFKNPYPLFTKSLKPHQVGASYCNWFFPKKWLTSSIFVADLTKELHEKITTALSKNLNDLYRNKVSVLDMEVFNWVFGEGRDVKIINDLFNMDSHYIDKEHISSFYNKSMVPYFVHFSHVKPHLARRYSSCLDESKDEAKAEFFKVHRMFWQYYYLYC